MDKDRRALRLAAVGKAEQMWKEMNASEKHGVRFGLFPAAKMKAAEDEGHDGHAITLALMDCASKDGGMIG